MIFLFFPNIKKGFSFYPHFLKYIYIGSLCLYAIYTSKLSNPCANIENQFFHFIHIYATVNSSSGVYTFQYIIVVGRSDPCYAKYDIVQVMRPITK